jgi:hypothetical protein
MTMHAIVDENYAGDVASNLGWINMAKWGRGLSHEDYRQVVHLCTHGWSQEPLDLKKQLSAALSKRRPKKAGIVEVAKAILAALKNADEDSYYVAIFDGT